MKFKISMSVSSLLTIQFNLIAQAADDDNRDWRPAENQIKCPEMKNARAGLSACVTNKQIQYRCFTADGDGALSDVSGIVQFLSAQGFLPQMMWSAFQTLPQRDFTPTQTKDNKQWRR